MCSRGSQVDPLDLVVTKMHFSTFPDNFFFPTIMSFFISSCIRNLLFSVDNFSPIDFWQGRSDDQSYLTLRTPLNSCPAHLLACRPIFFTSIPSSYSRKIVEILIFLIRPLFNGVGRSDFSMSRKRDKIFLTIVPLIIREWSIVWTCVRFFSPRIRRVIHETNRLIP